VRMQVVCRCASFASAPMAAMCVLQVLCPVANTKQKQIDDGHPRTHHPFFRPLLRALWNR
jgi:hypothetical protein